MPTSPHVQRRPRGIYSVGPPSKATLRTSRGAWSLKSPRISVMTSVFRRMMVTRGATGVRTASAFMTRRPVSSYYDEARNVKMGESRSMNGIDATVRNDWTKEEIKEVYDMPMLELLYRASTVHRMFFNPREVQQCTLLSIKTGGCTEDCGYCSQSVRHKTFVKPTPQMKVDEVLAAAKRAKDAGSTRFCMGAAWRELGNKKKAFNNILEMVREVNGMGLEVCCTLGMLNEEQARQLKEAGLTAYNHNLDTSKEYYPSIITTRTFEDRLETIGNVRAAGISVCCGGILGMGEAENDRVGLLHTLATLEEHPESVPINALVPVDGTPVASEGKADAPDIWDMGRMIATARVVMPKTMVRLSAGRLSFSEAEQAMMFMAGANSIFTGDRLLTTSNPEFDTDKALFEKLGLNGKPAHSAPLQPPLKMTERVVVTRREVVGAGGAVVDVEETQSLRHVA